MNAYTNNSLREVVCKFQFLESETKWDSAYFGQYFDKIKDTGFTLRQEQKGVRVNFDLVSKDDKLSPPKMEEMQSQMIFQNPDKGFAILMGFKTVSFHIVNNYTNWENFCKDLLEPYLVKYLELGLYSKAESCGVVYLSDMKFPLEASLNDYYTVIPAPLEGFGEEDIVIAQKNYFNRNDATALIYRLHATRSMDINKNVEFECSGWTLPSEAHNNMELIDLARKTHGPIRAFFEGLITDKLRKIL